MSDIFSELLKIDSSAKEKIDQINEEKKKITAQQKERQEAILRGLEEEYAAKTKKLEENFARETKEKIFEIENAALLKIRGLKDQFEENHEKWEEDIIYIIKDTKNGV